MNLLSSTYGAALFCRLKHFLNKLLVVGYFVFARIVIIKLFQFFASCVLSLGSHFIKIPVTYKLLYMTPEEDRFFYPCILYQFWLMAFTKFVISPRLMSNRSRYTFDASTSG